MQAPCYKCTERNPCCHDECGRYQAYKEHRKAVQTTRQHSNFLESYFSNAVNKSMKRRRQHA